MTSPADPLLSIVVCGRNDDYGESFGLRCQTFLRHLASLDHQHKSLFELVFVEWNPPADRPSVAAAFNWSGLDNVRIVTVTREAHDSLPNPGSMPLFEFWAKNVGVRRARGAFVLSTNPDIILSPAFFDFIARGDLDQSAFYRADRYDVAPDLAFIAPGGEIFARALDATFEVHTRNTLDPDEPMSHFVDPTRPLSDWPQSQPFYKDLVSREGDMICAARRSHPLAGLHTQASGDFVMASQAAWAQVRGHRERTDTCTHLDSYLIAEFHAVGLRQHILRRPIMALHMDHSREEIKTRPVRPYEETYAELVACASGAAVNPNSAEWGLADWALPETAPSTHTTASQSTPRNLDDLLREMGRINASSARRRAVAVREASAMHQDIAGFRAELTAQTLNYQSELAVLGERLEEAARDRDNAAESFAAANSREREHETEVKALTQALAEERAGHAHAIDALTTEVRRQRAEADAQQQQVMELREASARHAKEHVAGVAHVAALETEIQRLGAAAAIDQQQVTELREASARHTEEHIARASHIAALETEIQTRRTEAEIAQLHLVELREANARLEGELRGIARIWARERAVAMAERDGAQARIGRLTADTHDLRAQIRTSREQAQVLHNELLTALDAVERLRASSERSLLEDKLASMRLLYEEQVAQLGEAQRALVLERQQTEAAQALLADQTKIHDERLVEERAHARLLLETLEADVHEREARHAALETKLRDAAQQRDALSAALATAEAERNELLSVYKPIVDNSRYLKLRRTVVSLFRRH